MSAYDVELLSLPRHVATADVATALSLGFDETATMLGRLPALVAQSVDELDAEALFHGLRDLGAEVRLNPVAGPPSQRPSARPGERAPSFRPGAPPVVRPISSRPSAAPGRPISGPPSSRPPSRRPAPIPIDLPGLDDSPLELDLEESRVDSLRPPAAHSQPPVGGISPYPSGPSSVPPMGGPPSQPPGHFSSAPPRPMSSRPPSSAGPSSRPPEELLGEVRGSFVGALPGAYAYAFDPGVVAQSMGTAFLATLPTLLLHLGIYLSVLGALLHLGVISLYLFALIGRASMNKPGAPGPSDTSHMDDLLSSSVRVLLAFVVPLVLIAWLAGQLAGQAVTVGLLTSSAMLAPVVLAAIALWLFYLPSSLILAAHGQGCLGGLNLVAGVKLIVRAPVGYILLCLSLLPVVGLLVGTTILGGIAEATLPFFISSFIATALSMFPLTMGARLLGLYMYHYEYELGLA